MLSSLVTINKISSTLLEYFLANKYNFVTINLIDKSFLLHDFR